MSDVNANIRVHVDTQQAAASLAALQQQIATLNASMARQKMGQMGDMGLGKVIPDLKGAQVEIKNVASATAVLDKQLAGMKAGFGKSFGVFQRSLRGVGTEMQLATQKAEIMNDVYYKLGTNAAGSMTTVARAAGVAATRMEVFKQQMVIGARALDQMGTAALNWGKNMQWAGRQLMVGFTVPLTIFSGLAVKAFMDVERAFVNFQRVYGDFDTSVAETERMTDSIRELAVEMSKLGFTAQETIELAGKAAATGTVGDALVQQVEQASKLASLGQISQEAALDTIISLSTAFGIQSDKLAETVDFLNAVENQTVLALEDVAEAIPLVAPVIQGLGGDVKDLAVMLTAMREGGINANEGANALKTSLARLITPTKQATETAAQFGINLDNIVQNNAGDLMGMIDQLAMAMEGLSELQKQQLLSDVFGKRQFARMGTMFNNISKEGSQAAKTMELVNAEASDLAALSEKELSAVRESATMQFKSALETFQLAIAPIGEMVLKIITPLLEFGTKIANGFNNLSDGAKQFGVIFAAAIGVVIPAALMLTGLVGNLVGNLINGAAKLMRFAAGAQFATNEEMEMALATNTLNDAQGRLANMLVGSNDAMATQALMLQRLQREYAAYAAQINASPATARGAFAPRQPLRFATGGKVPGSGNKDTIPALLTPGEMVINKSASQKHGAVLKAINNGSIGMYNRGGVISQPGSGSFTGSAYVSSRGNTYDFSNFDFGKNALAAQDEMSKIVERLESWGHSSEIIADVMQDTATTTKEGQKKAAKGQQIRDRMKEDPRYAHLADDASGSSWHIENAHQEARAGADDARSSDAIRKKIRTAPHPSLELADDANRVMVAIGEGEQFQGRQLGSLVAGDPAVINQKTRIGGAGQGWMDAGTASRMRGNVPIAAAIAPQLEQAEALADVIDDVGYSATEAGDGLYKVQERFRELESAAGDAGHMVVETMDDNAKAQKELARRQAIDPNVRAVTFAELQEQAFSEVEPTNASLRMWRESIEEVDGGFRTFGSVTQKQVDAANDYLVQQRAAGNALADLPDRLELVGDDLVGHYGDDRKVLKGGKSGKSMELAPAVKEPGYWGAATKPTKTGAMREFNPGLEAAAKAQVAALAVDIDSQLGLAISKQIREGRFSQNLSDHIGQVLTAAGPENRAEAERLATNLTMALSDPDDSVKQAAITEWSNFGASLGDGLTAGLKGSESEADTSAKALALSINKEFKRVEGIKSPSRVWKRFGEMLADGLTLGLRSKKGQLNAAGAEAAQATNQGFQSVAATGNYYNDPLARGMAGATGFGKKPKPGQLNRFAGIGRGLQKATGKMGGAGAGGALMMGSMVPMMMADDQGKIAGKVDSSLVMSGMMVAGMFQTMIPMLIGMKAGMIGLIGVIGGAAAALGLAAFSIYKWRDAVDKAATSAMQAGDAMASFGQSLDKLSAVTGKSSLVDQEREYRSGLTVSEKEQAAQFRDQLSSEQGQEMIDELVAMNSADRQRTMVDYAVASVQSGMMTNQDAATFAKELGIAVGDAAAGSKAAKAAIDAQEGAAEMLESANKERQKIMSIASDEGQKVSYVDASRQIGAATAGIKSYSEVMAKAELDYANGIITYNDYIKIIDDARAAQGEYNKVIRNALDSSSDKGATKQAMKREYESMLTDEERDKISKAIERSISPAGWGNSDRDMFNIQRSQYEAEYIARLAENDPRFAGKTADELMTTRVDGQALATTMGLEAKEAADSVKAMKDQIDITVYALVQQGRSVEEITTLMNQIINDPNGMAARALQSGETNYNTLRANADFDSMDNGQQIKGALLGVTLPGQLPERELEDLPYTLQYLNQIADAEERLAEARKLGNMEQEDAEAIAKARLSGIDKKYDEYIKKFNQEGLNVIDVLEGGDLTEEQVDYLFNAYINGDPVDPEKLLEIINGVSEAQKRLAGVSNELLVNLDIDPDSIADQERYSDPETIDRLNLAETMMNESLPEEVDRTYASKFIVMDGKGNILSPDQMSKNLVKVKKAWNSFSKKDDKTEGDIVEYAIKVMPRVTMDGKEVGDKQGAQAAYDMINDAIGLDKFNTLDIGTQQAILNLAISTNMEGADDAARGLYIKERLATPGVTYAEAVGLAAEAAEIDARNKEREAASARMKAMAFGNPSSGSSDGGGGGGEDDKDWFEQLDEDAKWATKMYGRLTAGEEQKAVAKIGWIDWLRRNTKLSEEAIQAIVEDEEAMEKLRNKKGKKAKVDFADKYAKKDNKKYLKERRDEGRAQKDQNEQADRLFEDQGRNRVTEFIAEDPQMLAAYQTNPKKTLKVAREIVAANTTQLDLVEDRIAREELLFEAQQARLNLLIAEQEYAFNIANIPLQERNVTLNAQIAALQASGVDPIREKIKEQQYLIKQIEREYIINQKNLEKYEDQTKELQRRVSDMRRALDLRQREGQMLDHDLKLMSWAEQDINDAYEERVEALDKVLEINQAIAQSQQDQLGLADALSRGDIGAAAAAAQQMQQNQMQFANDQARYQLERAKDNAIDTLTGAESGMTREQIEDRQRELEEDSYYTNLQIRDLEDQIYDLSIKIRNENDIIDGFKDKIQKKNELIRDLEWDILNFERDKIWPLEQQVAANDRIIKQNEAEKLQLTETARIDLAYSDERKKLVDARNTAELVGLKIQEAMGKSIKVTTKALKVATRQANEFWKGIESGNGSMEDLSKIQIPSLSDALASDVAAAANFTIDVAKPFEEIVAANSTYNIPTAAVSSGATSGIMSSVTNNYNSNNNVVVNTAPVSSPDAFADAMVRKLVFASQGGVGSY